VQKYERRCQNWINSYLTYTSALEAPSSFHFWTAISTLAGALRRNVCFNQHLFKWFPNFYIVFVARPGIVQKSTTMDIGMRLLRKIEGISFGPESVTWQSLVSKLAEARQIVEYPNGDVLTNCCITIPVSEFGTFFNAKDHGLVDHLVSLWDGRLGTFEKSTKGSGDDKVENPWINIIAGTTPSWIKEHFGEYMIGGGFMSRTIFVYADQKREYIAYPKTRMQEGFELQEKDLLDDLEHIAQLKGEYSVSSELALYGQKWYEDLFRNPPEHLKDEQMQSYVARKQTQVHKLAMVLCAAYKDSFVIEVEDFKKAVAIMDDLERTLPMIFGQIGTSDATSIPKQVLELFKFKTEISKQDIYQRLLNKAKAPDIENAIQSLLRANIIQMGVRRNLTIYKLLIQEPNLPENILNSAFSDL